MGDTRVKTIEAEFGSLAALNFKLFFAKPVNTDSSSSAKPTT